LEVYLVVLDGLLRPTTKKGVIFGRKSAPPDKIPYYGASQPCFGNELLNLSVYWSCVLAYKVYDPRLELHVIARHSNYLLLP